MVSRNICSKRISLSFEQDSGSSGPEATGSSELPVTSHTQDCPAQTPDCPVQGLPLSWGSIVASPPCQISFPHTECRSVSLKFPGCGPPSVPENKSHLPQDSRHTLKCVKAVIMPPALSAHQKAPDHSPVVLATTLRRHVWTLFCSI